jgi:hypothetical protein
MDFTLTLRPNKWNNSAAPSGARQDIKIHLHEPDTTVECPILQESIKSTSGLDWCPRPFHAEQPKFSAITLQCKHTFHAMALVYNWARNRHVLCPVCRAGPKHQQLVISKLPNTWKYSLAARLRREWKEDKNRAEEEDRQAALALAAASAAQQNALQFVVLLLMESADNMHSWMGRAIPVPGVNALIFYIPLMDIATIPFVRGNRIRILPLLHVFPTNIITNLPPSQWFELGSEDPGFNFSVLFHEEQSDLISHLLYAVNEDHFTQAMATSVMLSGETT